MKIGLFTDTFYPEINGVATSCLNLQRELMRRGFVWAARGTETEVRK